MPYKDPAARKAYAAKHYKENTEGYEARRKNYRRAMDDYVDDLKRSPCTDCGKCYEPCQMQFDHTGTDKVAGISELIRSKGIETVKAEIAKCELVCANCHALRTWHRHTKVCHSANCGRPAIGYIIDGQETKYYCSKNCVWLTE